MADQPPRRIIFEIPTGVTLSTEEMESLAGQFQSQLIDSKAEALTVQARPKEKVQEVPVIVQVKEVALPKEQAQTA
jgi:hypothetical protein